MEAIVNYISDIWKYIFGHTEDKFDNKNMILNTFIFMFPIFLRWRNDGENVVAYREDTNETQITFYKVDDWYIAEAKCRCNLCYRDYHLSNGIHHVYFRKEAIRSNNERMKIIATITHEFNGTFDVGNYFVYDIGYNEVQYHTYRLDHNTAMVRNVMNIVSGKPDKYEETKNHIEFIDSMRNSDRGLYFALRSISSDRTIRMKSARNGLNAI